MKPKLLSCFLSFILLVATLNPGYTLPTDPVKSTTETTDPETDQDKKKTSSKHTEVQPQTVEPKEKVSKSLEVKPEEEKSSIYSLSYNFIFYVIYKIKYADIFNFKKRHDANNQLSLFDSVNRLYQTVKLLR
ncbi:MAG: hypothetical protein ACR2MX_04545 [Cyclobacteriaceae bacterium]